MAPARPLTAMFLGLIFGLAVAVILQQEGIWPLDKLTVFLLPGVVALIFVLIERMGRLSTPAPLAIALLILVAPVAWGLTGIGEFDETGELNGGCSVEAASDVDTTVVTDTSRRNPFDVEPDGSLGWIASSPGPITNHVWEIWVAVGGFEYVVADGAEENTDLDIANEGDEPTVSGYVEDLGFRSGEQIQGVYEVGGFIEGEGGACDGFGFVRIEGEFLGTIFYGVAFALALLSLLIFIALLFTRRGAPEEAAVGNSYAGTALAGTRVTGLPGGPEDGAGSGPEPDAGGSAGPRGDERGDLGR